MTNHPALLPNGLLDLLAPRAENEARLIELFMREFAAFGYERVKPPLVEFEDSLLGEGPGQSLARQTFRLMDPVSQRMMGVRADVTAQIARVASSRLGEAPRPLRLSYAADVLRVNGTQLRPERQFCQVGCELVGVDAVAADVELALVALKALASSGIGKLSIDLTVPTLVQHIYDETGTSAAMQDQLNDLIEKRDRDAIIAHGGTAASLIVMLLGPNADRAAFGEKARADLERLDTTALALRTALGVYGLDDIQITVDPVERRGFEYQTGVSFTLFALGARGELGRGGRYDITGKDRPAETASGFTLYMDTILRVAPPPAPTQRQEVANDASWDEIKYLQSQGLRVCRRFD